MFKTRAYLLGASGIEKNKEGKELDLCLVRFLVTDKDGGLIPAEFFYGTLSNVKGINALVQNNSAMPVPVEAEFAFREGKNSATLSLINFVPLKS